jgi:hypothetical protein
MARHFLSVDIETFVLFSREIPSQNLGFVDPRSNTIDITVHGKDFTIRQSPTVLSSNRAGGTTGSGRRASAIGPRSLQNNGS